MSPSVEIRVHVSGPSRGSDDARYRKEAQGLLNFEKSQRMQILGDEELKEIGGTDSSSPFFKFCSNLDETVSTSESLSPTQRREAIRDLFHSRLQSETPQASPVRYPALRTPAAIKLASPVLPWTSIKETPRLLVKGTPFPPRPQTAPGTPSKVNRNLTRSHSDSWETPPSVIPDSQEARPSPQLRTLSSPILKRDFPGSSASEDMQPSPTRKRVRRRSPSPLVGSTLDDQIDLLQTQELGPASANLSQDTSEAEVLHHGSGRRMEIRPARGPAVGNHKFKTHLTPCLSLLASKPDIRSLDIRCSMTGPVKVMDRGYWRVDITAWKEEKKEKLWEYLQDIIGRGKAGWGVWCARNINPGPNGASVNDSRPVKSKDVVEVWCFGQVIREVFIILYIGGVNNKENPGSKAEWIDGWGRVIATAKGKYLV